MADEFTPNYGFFLPKDADSMADPRKNITDTFEKISTRADPTVITAGGALPQSGDYSLGDRVFRNDVAEGVNTWPSSYILVCKDSNFGWHWRPIQQMISPWVSLTSSIWATSDFEIHPTYGLAIALDSRGFCHWRGAIRKPTSNIAEGTIFNAFKNIPTGIRPNTSFNTTLAVSPIVSGTGQGGYVGGRLFMKEDGTSSFKFFNTNNATSQVIWITGLRYNNSAGFYYSG